jgi:hypothetical protein
MKLTICEPPEVQPPAVFVCKAVRSGLRVTKRLLSLIRRPVRVPDTTFLVFTPRLRVSGTERNTDKRQPLGITY